jgi:mercuric ion transport protein
MPAHSTTPSTPTSSPAIEQGGKALLAGGLAALFASACCLGPLVLILVGTSGAWIRHLTALEPYQPLFMGVSLAALFFAARSIWRPTAACEPGQVCAIPRINRIYKLLFGVVVLLLTTAMAFPLIAHWFY